LRKVPWGINQVKLKFKRKYANLRVITRKFYTYLVNVQWDFTQKFAVKIKLLLLNWIEQKKYLDAESTTSSLSKDIDLPIHHVTYFFNNVNDEKYIEWRNRKRIEYAMSLINSKNGYNKTIENLGKESGFKSYSAFIQSFKQITGKLPKDYIRDLKIYSLPVEAMHASTWFIQENTNIQI
jgi:AraC-like DNA-binding protein